MADTRFQRDQRIRNAVEAFTNLASSSKESVEEAVLSAVDQYHLRPQLFGAPERLGAGCGRADDRDSLERE